MTSIEWLAAYIKGITSLNCDDIIEQAKEMHKQEVLNSFSAGAEDGFDGLSDSDAEVYYETLVNGKDWSKVTLEMRALFKQPKKD
jgi:hypothetical protein